MEAMQRRLAEARAAGDVGALDDLEDDQNEMNMEKKSDPLQKSGKKWRLTKYFV